MCSVSAHSCISVRVLGVWDGVWGGGVGLYVGVGVYCRPECVRGAEVIREGPGHTEVE